MNTAQLAKNLMWRIHTQHVDEIMKKNKNYLDKNIPMHPMVVTPPTQANLTEVLHTLEEVEREARHDVMRQLHRLIYHADNNPDKKLKKNKAYQELMKEVREIHSKLRDGFTLAT